MNDIWQTEELLFGEIADQLKGLPEFARFPFSTNLKLFIDANLENRVLLLQKNIPSPKEILNRWAEQADLLRHCGLNETLDFLDAPDFIHLVEGTRSELESKFSRFFNSVEKPKKLCNLVQISHSIRKIQKQKKLATPWIPKLLLELGETGKLKNSSSSGDSGVHPRIAAQEMLCLELLKDFKTNRSVLKKLSVLPANAGKIIAVFDQKDLPSTPHGIKFLTSKQETGMTVVEPGIICEFPGVKPFGNPSPKILASPMDQFFATDELKVLWNNIGKNGFDWSDASDVVKLIAWNVALDFKNNGKPDFRCGSVEKVIPLPNITLNAPIAKIKQPPIVPIPTQPNPSTVLEKLADCFKALPSDYRILDQEFAKLLNTLQNESAIVIRTKTLPHFLSKFVPFENNKKTQIHDDFFANLKLNLLPKGLVLLPKEPLPRECDATIKLNALEVSVFARFSDSIPENQCTLIRFGIAEGSTVIEKALVHRSMGKYPPELKEMIDILSQYPPRFSLKYVEKLEDFAINKNSLQLASTDFYQFIYQDENKPFLESNPEMSILFLQKLEMYLRKNFAIKTFDPTRITELPDNYTETMQGRMATNGRIRKVIRPGLIDQNDRLRMTALVERD